MASTKAKFTYSDLVNNYDLWSDSAYGNYDFEAELKNEYKELGYDPRELSPVGKEVIGRFY